MQRNSVHFDRLAGEHQRRSPAGAVLVDRRRAERRVEKRRQPSLCHQQGRQIGGDREVAVAGRSDEVRDDRLRFFAVEAVEQAARQHQDRCVPLSAAQRRVRRGHVQQQHPRRRHSRRDRHFLRDVLHLELFQVRRSWRSGAERRQQAADAGSTDLPPHGGPQADHDEDAGCQRRRGNRRQLQRRRAIQNLAAGRHRLQRGNRRADSRRQRSRQRMDEMDELNADQHDGVDQRRDHQADRDAHHDHADRRRRSEPPRRAAVTRLLLEEGDAFAGNPGSRIDHRLTSSTRRFRARPSSVSLVSLGRKAPKPAGISRPAAM